MRTLVIIPTYNERDNLGPMVGRIRASVSEADVLVVDDNSPDGTGEIADALAATDASVHVLHRAAKDGLGAAYREGMRWALDGGFDRIVQMDADGSHRPEELHRLLDALGGEEGATGVDLVLGSRWLPDSGVVDWPFGRRLLSRGGSAYSRIALGVPARDVTGGYRAFTADALRRIHLSDVGSQGYCFQIDMLRRAYRAGLSVAEVPITFVEREHGASKMTTAIVAEAMFRVAGWGISDLPGRFQRRSVAAPLPETAQRV